MQSPKLLYQKADLILKVQVVDGGMRKLFKANINILDKKGIARLFETLRLKFDIKMPETLKEELNGWDALKLG